MYLQDTNAAGNFGNRKECSLEKQKSVTGSMQLLKASGKRNMLTQVCIGMTSDAFVFYSSLIRPGAKFFLYSPGVTFVFNLKSLLKFDRFL